MSSGNPNASNDPNTTRLLQSITRDPNYVAKLQGVDEPRRGREWDGRFGTGKIPTYDALNDRFCKFTMRRRTNSKGRKPPPKQGAGLFAVEGQPNAQQPGGQGQPMWGVPVRQPGVVPGTRPLPNQQALVPTSEQPLTAQTVPGAGGSAPEPLGAQDGVPQVGAPPQPSAVQIPPGQTVESLFARSKARIVKLWDELGVSEAERLQFAQFAMSAATLENVGAINDEIQVLLDRRNGAVQVEKAIEVREGFLYLLQELAERCATTQMDKDRAVREMNALVAPFRNASMDVIEGIVRWREALRTPTPTPYLWKGVSYLHKMNSDLFFLVHSTLGQLVNYEVRNNPLLDPRRVVEATSTAGGRLPPLRRTKDNHRDLNKDRLDRCERILADEAVRQQQLSTVRQSALEIRPGEGAPPAIAPDGAGDYDEEANIAALARDDDEQAAMLDEEEEWLRRRQEEARAVDRQHEAAVSIQTAYRGYMARRYVVAMIKQRSSAIRMQTASRQFLAKLRVGKLRQQVTAARKLQALQRGIMTRTRIERVRHEHLAATAIQRVFRGHLARRYADMLAYLRFSAVSIQKTWRGHRDRSFVRGILSNGRNNAATVVQTLWRGYRVRKNPKYSPKKITMTIRLQAFARGIIDRRFARELLQHRRAAIVIQAWYRRMIAVNTVDGMRRDRIDTSWRNHLAHADRAAAKIQATWAMKRAKDDVEVMRHSRNDTLAAQAIAQMEAEEAARLAAETAVNREATKIQAAWRGRVGRMEVKMLRSLHYYATQIQRIVRGFFGRRRAENQKHLLVAELKEQYSVAGTRSTEDPSPLSIVNETLRQASSSPQQEDAKKATGAETIVHESTAAEDETAMEAPMDLSPVKPEGDDKEDEKIPAEEEVEEEKPAPVARGVRFDDSEEAPAAETTVGSEPEVPVAESAAPVADAEEQSTAEVQPADEEDPAPSDAEVADQERLHAAGILQRFARVPIARGAVSRQREARAASLDGGSLAAVPPAIIARHTRVQREVEAMAVAFERRMGRSARPADIKDDTKWTAAQKELDDLAAMLIPDVRQERNVAAGLLQEHIRSFIARRRMAKTTRTSAVSDSAAIAQERDAAARAIQSLGRVAIAKRDHKRRLGRRIARDNAVVDQERSAAACAIQSAARGWSARRATKKRVVVVNEATKRRQMHQERDFAARRIQATARVSAANRALSKRRAQREHAASVADAAAAAQEAAYEAEHRTDVEENPFVEVTATSAEAPFASASASPSPSREETELLKAERKAERRASLQNMHIQFDQAAEAEAEKPHKHYPKDEEIPIDNAPQKEPHVHFDREAEASADRPHKIYPPDADLAIEADVPASPIAAKVADFGAAGEEPPSEGTVHFEENPEVISPTYVASPQAADKPQAQPESDADAALKARIEALQKQLEDMQSSVDRRVEEEVSKRVAKQEQPEPVVQPPTNFTTPKKEEEQAVKVPEPAPAPQPDTSAKKESPSRNDESTAPVEPTPVAAPAVGSSTDATEDAITADQQAPSELASPQRTRDPIETAPAVPVEPKEEEVPPRPLSPEESAAAAEVVNTALEAAVLAVEKESTTASPTVEEQEQSVEPKAVVDESAAEQSNAEPHVEERTEETKGETEVQTEAPVQQEPQPKPAPTVAQIEALQGCHRAVTSTNLVIGIWQRYLRATIASQRTNAAETIQRNARVFNAKNRVEQRRNEKLAALEEANRAAKAELDEKDENARALVAAEEGAVILKRQNRAAITIQCAYRCYNARFMLRWKIRDRAEQRKAKAENESDNQQYRAATAIQCAFRSGKARAEAKDRRETKRSQLRTAANEEATRHTAALKIQCAFRCHGARFEANWRRQEAQRAKEREGRRRDNAEAAAVRAIETKEAAKTEREEQERSAVKIQCAYRSYNARFERRWRQEAREEKGYSVSARALVGFAQPAGRGYRDRVTLRIQAATARNRALLQGEAQELAESSVAAAMNKILAQRAEADQDL